MTVMSFIRFFTTRLVGRCGSIPLEKCSNRTNPSHRRNACHGLWLAGHHNKRMSTLVLSAFVGQCIACLASQSMLINHDDASVSTWVMTSFRNVYLYRFLENPSSYHRYRITHSRTRSSAPGLQNHPFHG